MNEKIGLEDRGWQEYVCNKYKEYFDMASSFLKCAENLQDEFANKKINRGTLGAVGAVICTLFAKHYKTTKAGLLLCKSGYPEDALILARANFETALWSLYILRDEKDKEKRAQAFIKCDVISRKKALEKMLEINEGMDESKAELQKELDKVKLELLNLEKESPELYKLAWEMKNIKIVHLAKEANLLSFYRSFYWLSSLYAHSEARSSIPFISESKQGDIGFSTVPTEKDLRDVLIYLCNFLLYLMDGFNSLFKLGLEEILSSKWTEFGNFIRRATPQN